MSDLDAVPGLEKRPSPRTALHSVARAVLTGCGICFVVAVICLLAAAYPRMQEEWTMETASACEAIRDDIKTALDRFSTKERRLPKNLQELVPSYLSTAPTCPNDGTYRYALDGNSYRLSCSDHSTY